MCATPNSKELKQNFQLRLAWIFLLLAVYFLAVIATNVYLLPYPTDNDFQWIGWIAQHQTLHHLESYASAAYPPGYPFLLAHLLPYFKTVLHAVFFVQTVAMTLAMLCTFAISLHLFGNRVYAMLSMLAAMVLSIPVATSEFADGLAAALLLLGIWILLHGAYSFPAVLLTGALCGVASLLRFHYVVFLIIIPAALAVSGRLCRRALLTAAAGFVIGFLAGSSPALVINSIVHGNPFWSGTSPYNPGVFAMGVDWNNYPQTYNLWPIRRLIFERPGALIKLLANNFWIFLQFNYFWLGIPAGLVLLRRPSLVAPANLRFALMVTILYVSVTVLPKEVTDRVLLPATAVLAIIAVPAVMIVTSSLEDRALRIILLTSICALIVIQPRLPTWKMDALAVNRQILQALHAAGMSRSSEVFCNDWQPYNLDDPFLTPFYDYGAYMLLDSEYKQQRPLPAASTLAEWRLFFAEHQIRYLVIRRGTDLDYFAEQERGAGWRALTETDTYRVFGIQK
jgi:hypothetical protein